MSKKKAIEEAAKDLVKEPVELIERILYVQMKSILEEVYDQMHKEKDWTVTLSQMSEAMAKHDWWEARIAGTPLENDLPVIAAKIALGNQEVLGTKDD